MRDRHYWLFQVPVAQFDLSRDPPRPTVGGEAEWPVVQFANEIHAGDGVGLYLMRTAYDPAGPRGLYAIGEILSEPTRERLLPPPYPTSGNENELVVRICYSRVLNAPIGRSQIGDLTAMHSTGKINYRLSTDEWERITAAMGVTDSDSSTEASGRDPRVLRAIEAYEREMATDLKDEIERLRSVFGEVGSIFQEQFGTREAIERLSPEGFLQFLQAVEARGRVNPRGLFSLNLPLPNDPTTQAFQALSADLSALRRALLEMLHGTGDLAERVDRMMRGPRVRRYLTDTLLVPSVLLCFRDPANHAGTNTMEYKEQKLRAAHALPDLPLNTSLGQRFAAYEHSLATLPGRYGRDWDWAQRFMFYWSRSFHDHLENDMSVIETPHFADLMRRLGGQGLHFPVELVSNYLIALQTKRFTILTGISGTGKTRLAIEVAKFFQPEVEVRTPTTIPDGAVPVEVRPYMLAHKRTRFDADLLARMELPEPDRPTGSFEIEVRHPRGTEMLRVSSMGNGGGKELLFKGKAKEWFLSTFQVGDRFYLRPYGRGENAPDGLELLHPETTTVREPLPNYRVIPVRPDWTDNRGLLGYYNPLAERYTGTEFLRLLLDARAESDRAAAEGRAAYPFFAVLDEMNIARVEHYFSDFLSALESGEEIDLHDSESVEQGLAGDGMAVPRRVGIPENLFFTGTVNVDETTYMFSPKVLDRAFTIEFNEVDLVGYGDETGEDPGTSEPLWLTGLAEAPIIKPPPGPKDWEEFGEIADGELREVVIELNELLAEDNRHFGFRVANEIARFVLLAAMTTRVDDGEGDAAWHALDLAVMQKVLPKLHGTQQELEGLLTRLFAFCLEARTVEGAEAVAEAEASWHLHRGRLERVVEQVAVGDQPWLPRTAAKLRRMLDRVRRQGFTAYVE